MKDIKLSGTMIQEAIEKAMPKVIEDTLGSSYSSPIFKIITEEINKVDGTIRQIVAETISSAVNDGEFKTRLGEKVLEAIIAKGLK